MTARRARPVRTTLDTDKSTLLAHIQTPEGIWQSSRVLAANVFGTFGPAIKALIPIYFDEEQSNRLGITTMAVDEYYRCYISKPFIEKLVETAEAVSESNPCPICGEKSHSKYAYVAGVICHEAQHPVRFHSARAKDIFAKPRLFNVAADLEINDDLLQCFAAERNNSSSGLNLPRLCLPEAVLLPKQFREHPKVIELGMQDAFKDDLIAEFYYQSLLDLQDALPDSESGEGEGEGEGDGNGKGKGLGKMMDNNGQDCGSGAHGGENAYDRGDPSPDNPGISQAEGKQITREVANEIRKASATRGDMPAGMQRWAEEVLTPPKVDWRKHLMVLVRQAVQRAYGHDFRSWHRLGRTSASTGYKYLYPSTFTPIPRIGVVLDTSGSMGAGPGSPLYEATCEVEGICKQLNAQVVFVSVDAAAGEIQEIGSIRLAKLQGGGGTDMRIGVDVLSKAKNRPQVCVIVTDGYTPWPEAPVRGMPVVAAIVGDGVKDTGMLAAIPQHISKVLVSLEDLNNKK